MTEARTILVVDDELDMRIFIGTLLKSGGYRAVVCKDGKEGLESTRSLMPDLIILDVMMPGDGGVTMYKALKAEPELRNIPVCMLTGVEKRSFSHFIRMLNARSAGPVPEPDAYMEKPPVPGVLLSTIKRLLAENEHRKP